MHEEFVGIYSVPQIDAWTITTIMTDVFFRLNLQLKKVLKTMLQWIYRQHMSGQRTGVAKLIQELEQRAV